MASTEVNNRGCTGPKRFPNNALRKDGDWTCPNCGNLNFSFRTVCNQGLCGSPRPPLTPPSPITSPYRNHYPFYYGGVLVHPPSYGMLSQFGSPITHHTGIQYDYGLHARPRSPYGPPMFPFGSFGGINYGPSPRIDGNGYGSQSPPLNEGLVGVDHFASQKRRGGLVGSSDGDWICSNCDNVNFAFRTICNMKFCGAVKPSSNNQHTSFVPEGSWTCKNCGNLNYPFRNVCNRKDCRTQKTFSVH